MLRFGSDLQNLGFHITRANLNLDRIGMGILIWFVIVQFS